MSRHKRLATCSQSETLTKVLYKEGTHVEFGNKSLGMMKIFSTLKNKLLGQRKKKSSYNLPQDIIHDVSTRFRSELVISCNRKRNRDSLFTITLFFICENRGKLLVKKNEVQLSTAPLKLFTSCNGFLLFVHKERMYVIFNPITGEKAIVTKPDSMKDSKILGLYFHPKTEEYTLLLGFNDTSKVIMYGLKSKMWRKRYSGNHNNVHPCKTDGMPPIILNGVMYWLISYDLKYSQVLTFDLNHENFGRFALPTTCTRKSTDSVLVFMDNKMNLIEDNKGRLCLCESNPWSYCLQLWVLEEHHVWHEPHIIINLERLDTSWSDFYVVKIYNEDDFVLREGDRYYHYDLKPNKLRNISMTGSEIMHAVAHKGSLLSLSA